MATTENNVLIQKRKANGDLSIIYPITKLENVLNSDGSESLDDILKEIRSLVASSGGDSTLTGEIKLYGGNKCPEGYLVCDGSEVSRTTYKDLFDVIGEMFGSGDGATTFNVPDYRDTVPIGISNNYSIGQKVGENTHTLTQSEIPNYTLYSAAHTHSQNAHTHTVFGYKSGSGRTAIVAGNQDNYNTNTGNQSQINASTATNNNTTITVTSRGGGQPMNNMQKSLGVNYIIKT